MNLKVRLPTKAEWVRGLIAAWALSVTIALVGGGYIIKKQQDALDAQLAGITEVQSVAFTNTLRVGMLAFGVKGALTQIVETILKHHPEEDRREQPKK